MFHVEHDSEGLCSTWNISLTFHVEQYSLSFAGGRPEKLDRQEPRSVIPRIRGSLRIEGTRRSGWCPQDGHNPPRWLRWRLRLRQPELLPHQTLPQGPDPAR